MRHFSAKPLILLALALIPLSALAERGRLEEKFGVQGIVRENFNNEYAPGYDSTTSYAVAVERNPITGKLMMVAYVSDVDMTPASRIGLARFNPDGTLDTSFGTSNVAGLRLLNWSDPRRLDVDNALYQPDGKLLVTAFVFQDGQFDPVDRVLCRITAAGTFDPTFGSSGCTTLAPLINGPHFFQNQIAMDANGRIYVGGWRTEQDDSHFPGVVRVNSDGQIDLDFGLNGVFYVQPIGATGATLEDMAIRPDGRILMFGTVFYGASDTRWFVIEATTDGDLNSSFGPNDGQNIITYGDNVASSWVRGGAMVLLDDGRIATFGRGAVGGNAQVGAVLLSADGKTIDGSWGTGLNGGIDGGRPIFVYKAMHLPDGGFAATGYATDVDVTWDPVVIAFDEQGQLDPRFNRDGPLPGTRIFPMDATDGIDNGRDYALDITWSEQRVILAGAEDLDSPASEAVTMLMAVEMHDGLFKDGLEDL